MQFGRKSEKLERQIEQLELRLEELESNRSEQEPARASAGSRHRLFDNYGSETHAPRTARSSAATNAHGTSRKKRRVRNARAQLRKLGEDVSEMLEYVPASFVVIRHVRTKLSCTKCDCIVQAEAPSRPIERGMAGPGLLAHVLVE